MAKKTTKKVVIKKKTGPPTGGEPLKVELVGYCVCNKSLTVRLVEIPRIRFHEIVAKCSDCGQYFKLERSN